MSDEPLTPQLQAKLNEYQKALEAEFISAERTAEATGEDFETLIRDTFKEYTPLACAQIVWLAGNAESEAVRLKAAEKILSEAFAAAITEADPLKRLLEELANNDDAADSTNPGTERADKKSKVRRTS